MPEIPIQKYLQNFWNKYLYTISLYSRQISGTFVLLLIARYLSVYDYGLFSSYKNIAAFCLMFANLGFNEYILVSARADVEKVREKVSFFVLNAILLTITVCFISQFLPFENHILFCLVVFRTFFDSIFFGLILPYYQAAKKFTVISYINIVYSLFVILISVICFIFKLSLINFLILNIILGIINYAQCTYIAKIKFYKLKTIFKNILNITDKSIFAYFFTALFYYLYNQVPVLYVSTYINKESAALFFAAFTIASVISILIISFNQKILPELINNNVSAIRKILHKNFIVLLFLIIIITIFFTFFGKDILKLIYGQTYYENAYIVLVILSLRLIGDALDFIYGAYISACGKQKYKLPIQICGIFVSIICLLIFRRFGIIGVSITCLIAANFVGLLYAICSLILLRQAEKNTKYIGGINAI